jgi:TolB protein
MEGIVPVSDSGGDRGASRFEAIATWLSLWIAAGVFLVGWATQTGQTESATFSIYHVPGYLGLIALLAVVGERMFDRSAGGGVAGRLRSAWAGRSAGERVIVVGTVVLLAYVVLDILWQLVFGIGNGVDGRFAPTRLLLPVGLTLVASGWIVGAVVGGHRPGWLGVVAFTTILTVLNFWIGPWHAVFSPWSARPAVVADDLRTEIWTMAPDGNAQTRVVRSGPNEASEPVWSPDGQRIAYVDWAHAEGGDLVGHLWTVRADGSDARQVTDGDEWDWLPSWSPDGAWIAITSREHPAAPQPGRISGPEAGGAPGAVTSGAGNWSIYLVRPDGSDRRRITTGGESMAPVWSPDGSRIAYHGTRDGNLDLFVANADGSGEQRLTDDPADDWSATWAPDGSRLVFTSNRSGNDDAWVVPASGGPAIQLTHDPGADQVPAWSPDGARIAFVSDRTGDVEVWSMAADGSDLQNVTRSPGTDDGRWSVGWSHDGSRLVYARWSPPPLLSEPLVREDLGALGMLITVLALAIVALVIDAVGGLPFGGMTVVVGVSTLIVAAVADGWRFVPAAVLAGALADLLAARLAGPNRRLAVATALPATYAAFVLATVAVTTGLGWSVTLALGVVLAAGLIGFGLAIASFARSRVAERS